MADSTGRANGFPQSARSSPRHHANPQGQESSPNGRGRGRPNDFSSPRFSSLRAENSRTSLNEQFAMSRRDYEFGDEDDDSILEPAPVISAAEYDSFEAHNDLEDSDSEMSDTEILRLLHAAHESEDFYTLLGLRRDPPPSTAQIRAAYHKLSLAFHPDKQPHALKAAAEKYFTKLQKAYETLIEPRKRVVYDLEGEEGLAIEFGPGGAMGKGGDAERQLGVRTMKAEEFRKWFLNVMRKRERRIISKLVESSSLLKVVFARRHTHQPSTNDEGDAITTQSFVVNEISVSHEYTVPLPSLGRLLQVQLPKVRDLLQGSCKYAPDESELVKTNEDWIEVLGPDVPKLSLSGGISGGMQQMEAILAPTKDVHHMPQFTTQKYSFYKMANESVNIGTNVRHTFPEQMEGENNNTIASKLQGLDVDIGMALLPHRSFQIGLGKAIHFAKAASPFGITVRTEMKDSPTICPPTFTVGVNHQIGRNQLCALNWISGEFDYPSFLRSVVFNPRWAIEGRRVPGMTLVYLWAENASRLESEDEDDFDPDAASKNAVSANQVWKFTAGASSAYTSLSVNYGRDIFKRTDESPIRSMIRNSGEAVPPSFKPKISSPRGIRLDAAVSIGIPAILDCSVRGTRRIGDFSSVGLGVGINQAYGIYLDLSWSRLGQSISIPVLLFFNEEELSLKAFFYTVSVPCILYSAFEFIIMRPHIRRKRRRLIATQRKKLRENVVKRRAEAEEATLLMTPAVEHRQALENERGGLVILRAHYGVRGPGPNSWNAAEVAEVTISLAALVDNGQVALPKGLDKSQLIGFWDPAPLTKKVLQVKYLFGGKVHEVEVHGNEALVIPMRSHEV
jgi:DnaJ family protein C protein 11